MEYTFGLIGSGNMGGAIAHAVSQTTKAGILADHNPQRAQSLAEELGFAHGTNEVVAQNSQYLFLGVKPHLMGAMLADIQSVLAARQDAFVLVTMAAGLAIEQIQRMAGGPYPVIRIMPNTPVSLGAGMILYCADGVAQEDLDAFCTLMAGAGRLDVLPESLIDAGCAISGCGPAYVYLFIEALADGGVACGLPRDKAMTYAAQTLMGAAELVLESGSHPGALKDAVCSPGGSTIQGVRALEMGGFRSTAMEAVLAAYEKTRELGKKED